MKRKFYFSIKKKFKIPEGESITFKKFPVFFIIRFILCPLVGIKEIYYHFNLKYEKWIAKQFKKVYQKQVYNEWNWVTDNDIKLKNNTMIIPSNKTLDQKELIIKI